MCVYRGAEPVVDLYGGTTRRSRARSAACLGRVDGSFGHYGLGGSLGFAHPELGFSFGYTVNRMGPGVPADPRSTALIEAVVDCL